MEPPVTVVAVGREMGEERRAGGQTLGEIEARSERCEEDARREYDHARSKTILG
jgi:hypothetical protein